MPIYEYSCNECRHSFEKIVLSAREKVGCPNCQSHAVKKQLSVFSSPVPRAEAKAGGGCACTPRTCGCR